MELDGNFLSDYSDLLLKWVYWRTVIDQAENITTLLKFTYNIIVAVNAYLS
jgi:hypothetical protein